MARLNPTIRDAVRDQIPPQQCTSKSKRSQLRCRRYAVIGADVCMMHGGLSPQVKAKAAERISLAEAMKNTPRRQPWEVLEDAAHIADVLMQDARGAIEAGTFTAGDLDKLVSALDRAHRLSTSNVASGLAERRQRFAEGQAQIMHRFVMAVLNQVGLTPEQKALVPGVIKRVVEGELVQQAEIAA
jgi:hypothetical protein